MLFFKESFFCAAAKKGVRIKSGKKRVFIKYKAVKIQKAVCLSKVSLPAFGRDQYFHGDTLLGKDEPLGFFG